MSTFLENISSWGKRKHSIYKVFTPTEPAKLTFVERPYLNTQLENALQTPGKLLIVYGHSKSGKTTLVRHKVQHYFDQFIATPCASNTTFQHILEDAFDQLNEYFVDEKSSSRNLGSVGTFGGKFGPIELSWQNDQRKGKGQKQKRIIEPVKSSRRLAEALKKAKVCWIIEDFHKVVPEEKKVLTDNLKIFFDLQAKVIALGAVNTARQVLIINQEMQGRVAEIHVPLLLDEELFHIISKGEKLLNLEIEPQIKQKIIQYSGGLASICHELCLNLVQARKIEKTLARKGKLSESDFDEAIGMYLGNISDTLKHSYDLAIRLEDGKKKPYPTEIIKSLLQLENDEVYLSEIIDQIKLKSGYKNQKLIQQYVHEMTTEKRASVLRHDETSNKYIFNDPFFVSYAFSRLLHEFHPEEVANIKKNIHPSSRKNVLNEIIPRLFNIGKQNQV